MLRSFKDKKVLIMGLGLLGGGTGSARFFAKRGATVTVTDLKTKEKLLSSIKRLHGLPVKFTLGGHKEKDFIDNDLIIRNPDVLSNSPYLKIARENGVTIEMAESFFAKERRSQIIGITGTRGKSTVTRLVYKILKDAGLDVILAGNMPYTSTLELLDKVNKNTWVVMELSSFQLNGFGEAKISPKIAVITNIYPEHLNHYKNFTNYIDDKKNIFHYQNKNDFLILNKNNKYSSDFKREAKSKVLSFKDSDASRDWKLKLIGRHNRENVAAAIKVAEIFNIPKSSIKKSVEDFTGLAYHLEEIRTIKGVLIINDGISTSPEATIAGINSLNGDLILILGGNDKRLDFTELGQLINKKVKAVFLMKGTVSPKIKKVINKKLIIGEFESLKDVVLASLRYAKSKDIILFSPAATSFNWFNNVYERCKTFSQIVKSNKQSL